MDSQPAADTSESADVSVDRPGWLAYWQLLRVPAVFTAMADIFLGFIVTQGGFQPYARFLGVLLASMCLYWAGMVLNDVFDRGQDARERPGRPIPSGRVSLRSAVILSVVLIVVGLLASLSLGLSTLTISAMLLACILAYDGLLKSTILGPLLMGGCRFFNVMLGASTVEFPWRMPQLGMAVGLGIYIVGVTWFARTEAKQSSRAALSAGMGIVNLGLVWLAGLMMNTPGEARTPALVLLGMVLITINGRFARALSDPTPVTVQRGVRMLLLSLVTLDTALVLFFTGDVVLASVTMALLIPASVISRIIPMT